MTPEKRKPATGCSRGGSSKTVQLAGERSEATSKVTFRLGLGAEVFAVTGRIAETLRLLVRMGSQGFTSGEASPLRWARRTSHYVMCLRDLGVEIETRRERAGDATIGRYVLISVVVIVSDEGPVPPPGFGVTMEGHRAA